MLRVLLLLRAPFRQRHGNFVDQHSIFDKFPTLFSQSPRGVVMATVAAPPADRKASERKFYTRMALFLVAIVFLGFAPSFYLKGFVPPYPRPNPTLPPVRTAR